MRSQTLLCSLLLIGPLSNAQTTARDKGPNGLEAWTDDRHSKQFRRNTEPLGIIVARTERSPQRCLSFASGAQLDGR